MSDSKTDTQKDRQTNTLASRRASDAIKACPSLGLPQVGGLPEFEAPVLLEVQAGLPLALHPALMSLLLTPVGHEPTYSRLVPSAMQLGLLEAAGVAGGSREVPLHLVGSSASKALLWAKIQAGAMGLMYSNSFG